MPFEITHKLKIKKDKDGFIRQIRHRDDPYKPDDKKEYTPRSLADQYIKDASEIYGILPHMLEKLDQAINEKLTDEGTFLQYAIEKDVGAGLVFSYLQTHFGLPIWSAGLTLSVQKDPLNITLSRSTINHKIEIKKPDSDAKYKPNMDYIKETLVTLAETNKCNLNEIVKERLIVYKFNFNLRQQQNANKNEKKHQLVTLKLPPLDKRIIDGRHYVVTDVLFNLTFKNYGDINWRAFIEIETGSIVYLHAFTYSQSGQVFEVDPITSSGDTNLDPADTNATLNPHRKNKNLLGLDPPTPQPGGAPSIHELTGEYIELSDLTAPTIAPPTEPVPGNFNYNVRTDDFAAVNAYYHCDAMFRMVKDFGFNLDDYFDGITFPLPVDHRGMIPFFCPTGNCVNAVVNASATGANDITFMLAKENQAVGIACDVRVVYHEFSHVLLVDQRETGFLGFAHSFGDSLGAIRVDPKSALRSKSDWRYRTFPFISAVDRHHDRKVSDGWAWGGSMDNTGYQSEQILSTTLFRIYRAIGGDDIRLARREFASNYMTWLLLKSCQMFLPEGFQTVDAEFYADMLMDVDGQMPFIWGGHSDGCSDKVIRWGFEKQGLYQPPGASAPVSTEGAPPEADVYINDGRKGEYQYRYNFWNTKEIWNRHSPSSCRRHQKPKAGVTNYAYVRVRNRGTEDATSVFVKGYQCLPNVARTFPDDWKPLKTERISSSGSISPGGSKIIGPFEWIPEAEDGYLLMCVNAFGDPSNIVRFDYGNSAYLGSWPDWRLVPNDNNIAIRSMIPRNWIVAIITGIVIAVLSVAIPLTIWFTR